MHQFVHKNIYYRGVLFFILIVLCMLPMYAIAVTREFEVQSIVGVDIQPPSVPANLVETPIATSQINLSWDASTDDFALAGYRVWRDSVHIATTTGLTYEDTGLSPSVLYTYFITAFDTSSNESASSTPVSATTFAIPEVEEEVSKKRTSSMVRFESILETIKIMPGQYQSLIEFDTSTYTRSVIRWGRTSSYELGSIAEKSYAQKHATTITNLTPGTRYYFSIEGETNAGRYGVLYTGSFTTVHAEDIFPPDNVRNLQVFESGGGARLTWDNPSNLDFEKVRVVRNNRFYPNDHADGWVVYEGKGTSVMDTAAFDDSDVAYYTIFSYDILGNISSGAVVMIRKGGKSITDDVVPPPSLKPALEIRFEDILFIQDGVRIISDQGGILIDGSKQLTIQIPYTSLPEHLKTIVVTVYESKDSIKSFSFLLRVNKDRTAFVGTVAPFGVSGTFPMHISVYDYETQHIAYTEGMIVSKVQYFFVDEKDSSPLSEDIVGMTLGVLGIMGITLYIGLRRYQKYQHV